MAKIKTFVHVLALAALATFPGPLRAEPEGPPGLPFTEDFTNLTFRDATASNANWSTAEQDLVLAWRQRNYNAFGSGLAGTDITGDAPHSTYAVALGDLDGDGDLDVVAGNNGQPHQLYLNNGTTDPFDGVTGVNITADVLHSTYAIALGDVDRDGDLDLVAGNYGQASRLYLNNGTSDPFAGIAGTDITADTRQTYAVALGDLDGDGDLDFITGNYSQTNRLYLNNGTANPFGGVAGTDITSDTYKTNSLALGDLDGDGDLDLVAGTYGQTNGQTNRLYLNNGTANPFTGAGTDITADTLQTQAVTLGDVDGDGDLDLVTGNYERPNRLYLNNGTTTPFAGMAGADITTDTNSTGSLTLGDIDGDGDLDLVTGNWNDTNRLYLNNGTVAPFAGAVGADITFDEHFTKQVVLGDADADGDLDLVAGNWGTDSRLYLNNGTPCPFAQAGARNITADAGWSEALALGDVDGDGDVDVIAGNSDGPNRLYLNNGTADPFDGVAGADITVDTLGTLALALGDVDGDGNPDLVSANYSQPVRLHLNDGSAHPFAGVADTDILAGADEMYGVALGDVDGDGDLDLVTAPFEQAERLYLNNGTATPFTGVAGTDIGSDSYAVYEIALGDMDGDGDLDLVVGHSNHATHLYLNNGTADPFASVEPSDISLDSLSTLSIALGDVDRDGDLDVVAGNYAPPNRLYLNNGTADPFSGVEARDISSDLLATNSIALGDVDRDGDLDVVAGNPVAPNRLYLNDGTADPFAGATGFDITADVHDTLAIALADMDGDGDLDVAAGNAGQPNRLYLSQSTADPFTGMPGTDVTDDTNPTHAIALGDVDRDGDVDVVAGNWMQPTRLYLNNGTANPFAGVVGSNITTDVYETYAVALGDLDRDGDLDVVTGTSWINWLYLNNGTADPFDGAEGAEITLDVNSTRALALGDVDGDGDLDLVAGNHGQANRLYLNNGTTAPFADVTGTDITADADSTRAVALGDVDGDGDLDLVAGNNMQNNRLYLNDGPANPFPGETGMVITADVSATLAVALGDVDGDGDLDLVAGNGSSPDRLYLNNGTTSPFVAGAAISADADSTRAVALGDMDGDGDLDLVTGNYDTPHRLYLNNGTASTFVGVAGISLTAGGILTVAAVLGDVDGDGSLDLVTGNYGQANRLHQRARRYDTGHGRAASLRVDAETANIEGARLTPTTTLPPNTAIAYYLSNNGGLKWSQVRPGANFIFPTTGIDLRWRAELASLSPARTPRLDELRIDLARCTVVPVGIAIAGGKVQLTWTPAVPGGLYEVHRGQSPYFTPATPYRTEEASPWTDSEGTNVGDPEANYTYLLRAPGCGQPSSPRVAEFDYRLVPGQ